MVKAYLFDRNKGVEVDSWADSAADLGKDEVLWLDVTDPTEEEKRSVFSAFEVADVPEWRSADPNSAARVDQTGDYLRVTAVAVSDEERDPAKERVVVDCFVGPNWLLTAHGADVAVIDEFRERVTGKGEAGALDAPEFLATLLESVLTSYLRAFDEIEATLEEFDLEALKSPSGDPEKQIAVLVEARARVGRLRRSLSPHREVFMSLSHSEFDPISSEESAERFAELATRVDAALATARDAKDGIASSFDVLIVRNEHKTTEIIKVLTLVSILLLPGALLAGVAGMNVNFGAHVFVHSPLFWVVVTAIVLIALGSLGLAKLRRWI
jgi:magnesium transporter